MPKERELASGEVLAEIMATAAVATGMAAFDLEMSVKTFARTTGESIDMFVGYDEEGVDATEYRIVSSLQREYAPDLHPKPLPRLVWLLEHRIYGAYAPLKRQVGKDMLRYEPKELEDGSHGSVMTALSTMKRTIHDGDRILRVHAYKLEVTAASIVCEEGVRYGVEDDERHRALESEMLAGDAVDFSPERAEVWASQLAGFIISNSGILKP